MSFLLGILVLLLLGIFFVGFLIFLNCNFNVTKKYDFDKDFSKLFLHLSLHPSMMNFFVLNLINKIQLFLASSESPDPTVSRKIYTFKGFQNTETKLSLFTPKDLENESNLPCLVYFHGGGFVFYELPRHYYAACLYAKQGCKVAFVHYRSAAGNPFECAFEDSYASLEWVYKNSSLLKINPTKIAVGGDSAGGSIAAAMTVLSRERHGPPISFQLLIYPALSDRLSEDSQRFTDVPVFNARCFARLQELFLTNPAHLKYTSPAYYNYEFSNLPNAFVEVEEFDCLAEGALFYADLLVKGGAKVQVEKVKGSFHGYDFSDTPLTKKMFGVRCEALRESFRM